MDDSSVAIVRARGCSYHAKRLFYEEIAIVFSQVGSFVHVHDTRVYSTMALRNSVTDTQRIPAYNNTYIGIIPYHTYSTTQYRQAEVF